MKFLNVIIPKTRILFNLVKKYIKGKLTLKDVVGFLEPFLIYTDDLTYMQYKEINNFIYEKIKEYNTKYICPTYKQTITDEIMNTHVKYNLVFLLFC